MKLGFVTSILDTCDFEQVLDIASDLGFECLEVACWPHEKAERRYAGVSHIDVAAMDKAGAEKILKQCEEKNIKISSLAFYPNVMDPEKGEKNIQHLYKVIDASALLGINLVTTFIGRDQKKTVEENLELVKQVWPPILEYAQKKGVKVAIENCPMLFGPDQWPGGQNLMTTPAIWRKVFEILPYENLGLNYDPSHFVWQMMDYIAPIYEFADKIFHVHYKDIKVDRKKLDQVGIMAYPLDFMMPKLPGLGDVDWGRFVSALTDIGYNGYSCIEAEDRAFEGSLERVIDCLRISGRYMKQFVI